MPDREAQEHASEPQRRGWWFEDYAPGQVLTSAARTICEADVHAFAGLSGDFNPLHVDAAYAERTAFRGRIAHGLLVESIASGLIAQLGIFDGTIVALSEARSAFLGATRLGTTIHVRLEVLSVDEAPSSSRGRVQLQKQVFDAEGKLLVEGEWVVFVRRDRSRRDLGTDAEAGASEVIQ